MRRIFLLALAAIFALPTAALALDDAEYTNLLATSQEFKAADAKLSASWNALKREAGASYDAYLNDQRQWIAGGRDREAAFLLAQTPPAPEIAPGGQAVSALAYARVTLERAAKLDLLTAQIQNGPLSQSSLAGKISRDAQSGAYLFYPYPFLLPFALCFQQDLTNVDGGVLQTMQTWTDSPSGNVYVRAPFSLPGIYVCGPQLGITPNEGGMAWREQDQLLDLP